MTEQVKVPAVYAAIGKVMAIIAKDGVSKDRRNEQQGYKFRGIDDIYNALAPAMVEAGLVVIPRMLSRTCEERESAKGTTLFYVNVSAEFDMIAVSDGSMVKAGPFYGEAMDTGDKATNKAMSAVYKYWAMQTLVIPTDAENDADFTTHDAVKAKPKAVASPKESPKAEPPKVDTETGEILAPSPRPNGQAKPETVDPQQQKPAPPGMLGLIRGKAKAAGIAEPTILAKHELEKLEGIGVTLGNHILTEIQKGGYK